MSCRNFFMYYSLTTSSSTSKQFDLPLITGQQNPTTSSGPSFKPYSTINQTVNQPKLLSNLNKTVVNTTQIMIKSETVSLYNEASKVSKAFEAFTVATLNTTLSRIKPSEFVTFTYNPTEAVKSVDLDTFESITETNLNVTCSRTTSAIFTYEPEDILKLTNEQQESLRELCWETMFGQELVKLTIMDLMITIAQCLLVDYLRAVLVR